MVAAAAWAVQLLMLAAGCAARPGPAWDAMFDVPDGFNTYAAPKRPARPHRDTIDVGGIAFDEFLDEGDEDQPVGLPAQYLPQPPAGRRHHAAKRHRHHHSRKHAAGPDAADAGPDAAAPAPHHHTPSHHSKRHHHSSRHHKQHGPDATSFLELAQDVDDPEDAVLREAQHDKLAVPPSAAEQPPAPPAALSAAAVVTPPLLPPPAPPADPPMSANVVPPKLSWAAQEALHPVEVPEAPAELPGMDTEGEKKMLQRIERRDRPAVAPIPTLSSFKAQLKQLEGYIRNRPEGEQTLGEVVSDAAASGELQALLPHFDLRAGTKPGVLPGLTSMAETGGAALSTLLGDSGIAGNVQDVAALQANPSAATQFATHVREAIPDDKRLHPLSDVREQAAEAMKRDNPQGGHNPLMKPGQMPYTQSLLETDASMAHGLRKDQLVDLQYLRGIGSGLETLMTLFGSGAPKEAQVGLQMAAALKSVGSDMDSLGAQAFLQLQVREEDDEDDGSIGSDYKDPPRYPAKNSLYPQGAVSGMRDMRGGTYAGAPSTRPSNPENDLEWMIDKERNSKGPYFGGPYGSGPQNPLELKNVIKSIKAFITKGTKMIDYHDPSDQKPVSQNKQGKTDPGFQDWPQPFWWTRPPAWLDDVPGWMQRLQMKKAAQNHRHASFG